MAVKKPAKRTTKKTTKAISAEKPSVSETQTTAAPSTNNRFKLTKTHYIIGAVILIAILLYIFRSWVVVAIVNGQPISRISFIRELEKQAGKQTLNSLVTKTLIQQEAKKQKISVNKKEVDAEIKKIENNIKQQGKTLDEALKAQGLTKEDLIEQITIQKLIEKLLGKETQVSDQEVNEYIQQNSAQFSEVSDTPEFRDGIKQQLQQQKLSEKFQTWLAGLQKKAKTTYFVQY